MEKIEQIYQKKIKTLSDINEHLPTIKQYCSECDHITEMGVRDVVSTWAMLASNPKKMISYDIVRHKNVDQVEQLTKEYNIDFTFYTEDTLKCEIEQTDLLLIDTLHTYNQLINELKRHSHKVNKYIILHDTVSFGQKDENIYQHASDLVKSQTKTKQGLNQAVNDFLLENTNWKIDKVYTNNNGLTILKRNENINIYN